MLISDCYFVSAKEGAEWAGFEFVLFWQWLDTRSVNFFGLFLYSFKNQHIY